MALRFEWDPGKDAVNAAKHGVSFEKARRLFVSGIDYLEIWDEAHSDEEDRFIAIGPIASGVIVVAYTTREDDVIRLISARSATRREVALFNQHVGLEKK